MAIGFCNTSCTTDYLMPGLEAASSSRLELVFSNPNIISAPLHAGRSRMCAFPSVPSHTKPLKNIHPRCRASALPKQSKQQYCCSLASDWQLDANVAYSVSAVLAVVGRSQIIPPDSIAMICDVIVNSCDPRANTIVTKSIKDEVCVK